MPDAPLTLPPRVKVVPAAGLKFALPVKVVAPPKVTPAPRR